MEFISFDRGQTVWFCSKAFVARNSWPRATWDTSTGEFGRNALFVGEVTLAQPQTQPPIRPIREIRGSITPWSDCLACFSHFSGTLVWPSAPNQ